MSKSKSPAYEVGNLEQQETGIRHRLTELSQKYGRTRALYVLNEEGDGYDVVFVKYPNRDTMSTIAPLMVRQALFDVAEIVIEKGWIEGSSDELKEDPEFIAACMPVVENMILGRQARMAKK